VILQDLTIGDGGGRWCLPHRDGGVAPRIYRCRIARNSPPYNSGTAADGRWFVNLETSLRVGSKLGGHFVMGHVDGIGYLQALQQTATSWEMSFTSPDTLSVTSCLRVALLLMA